MTVITEIAGTSHVFTLKNGDILRLWSRKTVSIPDEQVSSDIRKAEKMKLIFISKSVDAVPKTTYKTNVSKKRKGV